MMALQQLVEGLTVVGSRPHAAPEAAGRRCARAAARQEENLLQIGPSRAAQLQLQILQSIAFCKAPAHDVKR